MVVFTFSVLDQKYSFWAYLAQIIKTVNLCMKFGTYNPVQNIWNKIDKSTKIGQDKKSLVSTFTCFLTAIAKV